MLRLPARVALAVLFVLVAGCSGGGCSSGCSCGGVTPLPNGFPPAKRIENAASVRLTESGITFIEDNLGELAATFVGGNGAPMTFAIPQSSGDYLVIAYDMCKDGPKPDADPPECVVEIDLANADLEVDPEDPHNVRVHGPLPVRVQKLPLEVKWLGLFTETVDVTINGAGDCPGNDQPFKPIGADLTVSIETDPDPMHARYGYSRIRFGNIGIDEQAVLDGIEYCDGGFSGAVLDAVDGLLIGTLVGQLTGTLGGTLEEALCQQSNPDLTPPCPEGTEDVDGICRYGSDEGAECASIILGLDGNIDLGALMASFSPGTKGAFDFLFAAGGHSERDDQSGWHWGDLNPIANGVTLGMYGGSEPTPQSACVPPAAVALPTGLGIPDEILSNSVAGWPAEIPGPHFGMAVSERFTNYLLAQLYNSGALCLGITADTLGGSVPLSTSLIGVGIGAASMNELGRQKQGAAVAIVVRPAAPPQVTFGNGTDIEKDPLLRLALPKVSFDFYVWSLDRFIRALTATMDIEVPANLEVTPEGLQPVIEQLVVKNASVTNSPLLREDPAKIAGSLEGLLGSMVGSMLGDAIPPIDLNAQLASLGLGLQIPPTVEGKGSPGLRRLTKGSDSYLGIFATLALPAESEQSETQAELAGFDVDPAGLRLESWTRDNGPRARIRVGSSLDDGTRAIEWQYRVDDALWHPFTRSRYLDVRDETLRQQGRHVVRVRSRVVGQVGSLDRSPAEVTLLVDDALPRVRVVPDDAGRLVIQADDDVSGAAGTRVRLRYGSGPDPTMAEWGPWSEWTLADELAPLGSDTADYVQVEAQDEDGHVATVTQPLIRGRGSASAAGCECRATGRRAAGHLGGWLLAALLGAGVLRRRPRSERRPPSRSTVRASRRSPANGWQVFGAVAVLFGLGATSGCSCSEEKTIPPKLDCRGRGDCEVLFPGLVGAYGSAAVSPEGELWVAGYLEGNWEDAFSWGDLVVGRYHEGQVEWKVVDGTDPNEEVDPETYDPKGFRGGKVDPGPDVGLWTSLAFDPDGSLAVAYYDATGRALKYARQAADGWKLETVAGGAGSGDHGRYAKLSFVGGQPTIAYQYVAPADAGTTVSGVRIATRPAAGGTWSIEDVVADASTPCSAELCPSGQLCVAATLLCTPKNKECSPSCEKPQQCVDLGEGPSCQDVIATASLGTYPDVVGLYVSVAPLPDGSLGVAYYDRVHGNVVVARKVAGKWATVIADGEAGGKDTGDQGIGTTLAIDPAGDYHLAYVDGLAEALRYVTVTGGTTPQPPEIVDDGLGAGDGVHLVGDDANIRFTQGGEVHIAYQDATVGTLKLAVGTAASGKHDWQLATIEQDGFAGFFPAQIELGGTREILNWWRVAKPFARGDVRLVAP